MRSRRYEFVIKDFWKCEGELLKEISILVVIEMEFLVVEKFWLELGIMFL